MKKVIYIIGVVLLTMASIGCTDYNLVDTGEANGNHQTTMWEYFKGDSYNWDSLVVMADYAGLKPIFDGTSKYGKQITFFGITNHSIRRYLLQNSYKRVKDIPKEDCRRMILNCVLNQRIMLDEFTPGRPYGQPRSRLSVRAERFTKCCRARSCGYILSGYLTTECPKPDR